MPRTRNPLPESFEITQQESVARATPEELLWTYVIADAISKHFAGHKRETAWLFDDRYPAPVKFSSLCDHLDLNPDTIRLWIKTKKHKKLAALKFGLLCKT